MGKVGGGGTLAISFIAHILRSISSSAECGGGGNKWSNCCMWPCWCILIGLLLFILRICSVFGTAPLGTTFTLCKLREMRKLDCSARARQGEAPVFHLHW